MQQKRFYYSNFHNGIKDVLTGKYYQTFPELCKLLNEVNDRADRNAELVDIDQITLGRIIIETSRNVKEMQQKLENYFNLSD